MARLQEKTARRLARVDGVDRRWVLAGMTGTVLASSWLAASARTEEVVVGNWGGAATDGFMKAWAEPLQKTYGMKLVIELGRTLRRQDPGDGGGSEGNLGYLRRRLGHGHPAR